MRAVFDTNILIDYLNGVEAAREELARHSAPVVSIVTWMEVLVGARNAAEEESLRSFLGGFEVAEVDRATAEEAIRLRRARRLRLPDAVIWATARSREALLVTRNTDDFPRDAPDVRVPYEI